MASQKGPIGYQQECPDRETTIALTTIRHGGTATGIESPDMDIDKHTRTRIRIRPRHPDPDLQDRDIATPAPRRRAIAEAHPQKVALKGRITVATGPSRGNPTRNHAQPWWYPCPFQPGAWAKPT